MALARFPGFIDAHVHLRDPGQNHKEDFVTGSRAALAGGFTHVLDMPNNLLPITSPGRLAEKIALRNQGALCDVGFYYGTSGVNTNTFPDVWDLPDVFGLKLYCNHTTGEMLIEEPDLLEKVFAAWDSPKPILVHAEGEKLAEVLKLSLTHSRRLHVCHITQADEVKLVSRAKDAGKSVSAGVTPHHLFMTHEDVKIKKSFAMMKPPLGTARDQQALWEGLRDGTIDIVETDHAPHTREEKEGANPPFGVPGLETAVGLIAKAVYESRLEEKDLERLLHSNPKKIFNIPDQPNTHVELDIEKSFFAGAGGYQTKCGWSPFDGWELKGKIETVVFRGKTLIKNGILVQTL